MEQTMGKRIMHHRKRLGLTQEQLAERLGVTAQAVSKWENDLSCPDISTLPKLAAIFGITIDTLMGNETEQVHEAEVLDSTIEFTGSNGNTPWRFKMASGRKTSLAFALMILVTGAQLLVARVMNIELSFWSALWPTALVALGALGFHSKFSFFNLGCVVLGGYFLLNNWDLLPFSFGKQLIFPAIIILFGISLLVDALRKPKKARFQMNHPGNPKTQFRYTPEGFEYESSFGEATQCISLDRLSQGSISTSFCDITIDLSDVAQVSDNCTLEANCSFGELEILVPKRFTVKTNGSVFMGECNADTVQNSASQGVIHLDYNVSFGEIHIEYI